MSTTSKARLNVVLGQLDSLFSLAHPQDVPELVKALRDDLSRRNSKARQPGYDKHVNVATASGHIAEELMTALVVITGLIVGVTGFVLAIEIISAWASGF